jgi:hypothetical protein
MLAFEESNSYKIIYRPDIQMLGRERVMLSFMFFTKSPSVTSVRTRRANSDLLSNSVRFSNLNRASAGLCTPTRLQMSPPITFLGIIMMRSCDATMALKQHKHCSDESQEPLWWTSTSRSGSFQFPGGLNARRQRTART